MDNMIEYLLRNKAFPRDLHDDVADVLAIFETSSRKQLSSDDIGSIRIDGKMVRIPYRIYTIVPASGQIQDLSAVQRTSTDDRARDVRMVVDAHGAPHV